MKPKDYRSKAAKRLFWRGVVATGANAAMAVGLYPILPHLGLAVARRRAKRQQPKGHVKAAVAEWGVSLAMAAARPIGFLGLPVAIKKPRGPRPIILSHGYAMNRANFLPLARRLVRAGYGPVYGFEYWTLGKIPSAATRLGEYIDEVCQATGAEQVDLVGHSMGGLVSRYYAVCQAPGRVRNLVTLGSPHRGTVVSAVGFGRLAVELAPGSPVLERLDAHGIPEGLRVLAIWSRSDALVPGPKTASLPGAHEVVYGDLGHLSLLASRRVARDIIEHLRDDQTASP